MSEHDPGAPLDGGAGTAGAPVPAARLPARTGFDILLAAVFTLSTFWSALLLFLIQPMFAKMALPVLGGAPSVWAVALLFFQGALLAGYGYAHLVNRSFSLKRAGIVHIGFSILAIVSLPIALPESWREPPPGDPSLWQLAMFSVAIGLPFVAIAANAPMLQAWFAQTRHRDAANPYYLYAASNLGSLVALIGYPLVLEPWLGLTAISRIWSAGYLGLIGVIALSWLAALRQAEPARFYRRADVGAEQEAPAPDLASRLGWVGLAMVPSALLTAFTAHIATDVASAPLIWVVPLAMYLLTFVIAFRDFALLPRPILLWLHLAAVVFALLVMSQTEREGWVLTASAGGAAFFLSAWVAHRTLYETRPAARHLTEFYLWMSAGGVAGGLFAALIAPRIFAEVFEYPLLLALTMACRPGALRLGAKPAEELITLWLIAAAGILVIYWGPIAAGVFELSFEPWGTTAAVAALLCAFVVAFFMSPPRQLVAALLVCLAIVMLPSSVHRGAAERSYFGVYRVAERDGAFRILTHGTTLHGAQRIRDDSGNPFVDTTPGTYYHPKSPMAHAVMKTRERLAVQGGRMRVGVIGLGTGSLACFSEPGESWRFFEIDPVIVRIATTPEKFSFISNCQPKPDIVIGDARLTMAKQADAAFDLIIVDAFTSDAVPVHLLTTEALRLYARKLARGGVLVLHISNRYLDLDKVVAATVTVVPELNGFLLEDDDVDGTYATSSSTVAVLSGDPRSLEALSVVNTRLDLDAGALRAWTDDYSDILGPLLARIAP